MDAEAVFHLRTLLASSLPVLPECVDETLRALRLLARACNALGRIGVHRRHRADHIPGGDLARAVRSAVAARVDAVVPRSDALARVCGAHHVSHVGRACSVAGVYADLRNLGGKKRASGKAPGAHSRYSAVGADIGFPFHYG